MKYLITIFVALLHLPLSAQLTRKAEIERFTERAYSAKEFRQVADSLQLSVKELSDYPVIFPIKNPVISFVFRNEETPYIQSAEIPYGDRYSESKGNACLCQWQRNSNPQRVLFGVWEFCGNSALRRFSLILCSFKQNDSKGWGFGQYRTTNCLCGQYRSIDR